MLSDKRMNRLVAFVTVAVFVATWLPFQQMAWGWWIARGVVAGILLLALWQNRRLGFFPGLVHPLFLIAAVIITLFSLAPAVAVELFLGGPVPFPMDEPPQHIRRPGALQDFEATVRAVTSPGELLMLRFALACIAVGQWRPTIPARPFQAPQSWRYAFAMGVAVAAANAGRRLDVAVLHAAAPFFPTMIVACLSVLAVAAMVRQHRALPAYFTLVAVAAFSFLPLGGVKFLIFAIAIQMVMLIASCRLSLRWQLALLAIGLTMLPITGSYFATRGHALIVETGADLKRIALGKLAYRQGETIFCLNHVMRQPQGDDPFYFIVAPVPRLLWPAKPSLSNGADHAVRYCGRSAEDVSMGQHSASITLLGEPLSKGGFLGLFTAQALLLALLSAAAWGMARGGAGAAWVLAMLPWMIDVDQDFALWLANLIKFGMTGGVIVMFLYGPCRFTSRYLRTEHNNAKTQSG